MWDQLVHMTKFTLVRAFLKWFLFSAKDGSVQTVISFDQGGEWVPLKKPENTKCDSTAKDPEMVRTTFKGSCNNWAHVAK